MKDLDMSDVFADAQNMEDEMRERAWIEWSTWSTATLLHQRYLSGIVARGDSSGPSESGIDEVLLINDILSAR